MLCIVQNFGSRQEGTGELFHGTKADGEHARLKADIAGGLIERGRDVVHLDKLAQTTAGYGLRARREKGSGTCALVDAVEKCFEISAGQEKTPAHLWLRLSGDFDVWML